MPFPYDKYPWINYQELNLAYFIEHFQEIFQQWDQLYHDLLSWQASTEEDLEAWKTAVEGGLESWKTGVEAGLETWKTETQADITGWETATLAALDAWKIATTAVFEEIRTAAAASATAAAGSASDAETAKTAAQTAQAAAEAAAATIESDLAALNDAFSAAEAIIVLGSNGRFTISGNDISFNQTLYIDSATPSYRKIITPAAAHDQLPDNSTLDDSTVTISVTANQTLVYNYTTSSLAIKTRATVNKFDVILFEDYYGVKAGLIWDRYWLDTFIFGQYVTSTDLAALNDAFSAAEADIILSSNGRFTISGNAITFSRNLNIFSAKPAWAKNITPANVHDQLPNNSTLDGSEVTITVPDNGTLIFDYEDNRLEITTRSNVTKNTVVLFNDFYGVKAGLIWNQYWRDKYRDSNYTTLKAVNDGIFNAAPYMGTYDWTSPAERYAKLFKTASRDIVTFAFFTDPHIMGFADSSRNEENMMNYIKKLQKVYNSVPCDFLVCGGDWLNRDTSDDEAAYRLGYVDGYMRSMFKNYHPMLGNHDTNYQGTTPLTQDAIDDLWFRNTDTKHAYYKFEKSPATCYVLDSGIEHSELTAYDYAQFDWFCTALAQDDPDHGVVFMHIITLSSQPMVTTLGNVITAYINHSTVTINGVTYDFSGCAGHIDFAVGGHTHTDSTGTIGGIPYFVTGSNSYSSNVPVIDLVIVDFDSDTRTVNLVRADGSDDNTKDRTLTF